ncbi:DUF917 domain-containing protein [Kordiimonas sp. SCSIO 12603]|uniref:DUF917 domain-containing protein n=1 Tax=Kordiimonas sp. SCSIO 12603 TaxID=2829596 RepID=UPI002101FEBE|nr:DUF917 domain-containing protein [Kordiimonas sp. SCSIO 12603]UTW59573.1 DUF917 domain-containing protein [Kordiimonas sp. SCSIO 12603]
MLARRQFLQGLAVATGALPLSATSAFSSNTANPSPNSGKALTPQILEDALVGSSYLGCGGGGSLSEARELIAADLASGLQFKSIDVDTLKDTDRVACPYALASLAPISGEMETRLNTIPNKIEMPVLNAFRLLEQHIGQTFAGVILGEIGPLSMAEGLSIAARLGVPALDADTVGRATPEINQHSVRVAGYPLTPAAGVTMFGDEIILQSLQDPSREEDIFRTLSVISRLVGVADAPITGAQAKEKGTLVTGSFSLATAIGKAARTAKSKGQNPIEAARIAGGGYKLFSGYVKDFTWEDKDGFLVGTLTLSGTDTFNGQTMLLDYKNEHLVAQLNGKVIATCPDLITVVDEATAEGVNNPDFKKDQAVTVLGFKCDPLWRTAEGLSVFAPRYFGYDVDYIPIEERLT